MCIVKTPCCQSLVAHSEKMMELSIEVPWSLLSTGGFSEYSSRYLQYTISVCVFTICTKSPKVQPVCSIWLILLSVAIMIGQSLKWQSDNRLRNHL